MSGVVRVVRLRAGAKLPQRSTEGASGFDVYACLEGRSVSITQLPALIPTGLAVEVPPGLDAQLRPRSGLARQGVLSTFGTLDADYRGELMIALYTTSPAVEYTVHDGDRIAQLVVTQLAAIAFEEAEALSETARGARGHGSTGR
jgi:dUTP pyrophosphatase